MAQLAPMNPQKMPETSSHDPLEGVTADRMIVTGAVHWAATTAA